MLNASHARRPYHPPPPSPRGRYDLLKGPYIPPAVHVGQRLTCRLRGKVKVCGWSDGRIPWPRARVNRGGKGAYVITRALERAITWESGAALTYWFGIGIATVVKWRRSLGVPQFNEGTRRLYSLWKSIKLPKQGIVFSPAALRKFRQKRELTQKQVARRMGWRSINSYGQLETGRRQRASPGTLQLLARIFGCGVGDLQLMRSRAKLRK